MIKYHNEDLQKELFVGTNNIFCFGSNEKGIHGAGAARFATEIGAKSGISFGLSGNTFAIPTKDSKLETLDEDSILCYLFSFFHFAKRNPELTFYLTAIGTGLAGYSIEKLSEWLLEGEYNSIFGELYPNVIYPDRLRFYFEDKGVGEEQIDTYEILSKNTLFKEIPTTRVLYNGIEHEVRLYDELGNYTFTGVFKVLPNEELEIKLPEEDNYWDLIEFVRTNI